MTQWRELIGHEGYLVARLRMLTSAEGGRNRTLQSGFRAAWWLVGASEETWVGEGPLDLVGDRRSLKPGEVAEIRVHPMDPSEWRHVGPGAVLHLRIAAGKTLGVATVEDVVGVPAHAPLRSVAESPRHGRGATTLTLRGDRHRWSVRRLLRRLPRRPTRGAPRAPDRLDP